MSWFLPGPRIVDTDRNPTDDEQDTMQEAENDPEWQLQRAETEAWCAARNAESHQQYEQEVENARPWWQKIF